jgi:hypothetical protein
MRRDALSPCYSGVAAREGYAASAAPLTGGLGAGDRKSIELSGQKTRPLLRRSAAMQGAREGSRAAATIVLRRGRGDPVRTGSKFPPLG